MTSYPLSDEEILDTALARLQLPIPTAKLHIIHSVANALNTGATSKATWASILRRLSQIELESEVLEILQILIVAKGLHTPSSQELRNAIKAPSILSDEMIAIAMDHQTIIPSWMHANSTQVPPQYRSEKSREKLLKGQVIPPIVVERILQLEKKSGHPFINQWTFEFDNIKRRHGASANERFHYFIGSSWRDETGFFIGRDSHIARSAYLRTLSLACQHWEMPWEVAKIEAALLMPCDPSLSSLLPGSPPEWADSICGLMPTTNEEAHAVAAAVCQHLETGKAKIEHQRVLHLDIPLLKSERYKADLQVYSALSNNSACSPEAIFRVNNFILGHFHVPRTQGGELEVARQLEIPSFLVDEQTQIKPAMLCLFGESVGYLHADLLTRPPYLLANFSSSIPLRANVNRESIDLTVKDKLVGRWHHWTWQWRPVHQRTLGAGMGLYLVAENEIVEALLNTKGMQLVRAWKVRLSYRDNDYGEWRDETFSGHLPFVPDGE